MLSKEGHFRQDTFVAFRDLLLIIIPNNIKSLALYKCSNVAAIKNKSVMTTKSIPKSELNSRCRGMFESFGFSERSINEKMSRIRKLHSFMEERDMGEYTRSVGDEYVRHIQSQECYSVTYKRKSFYVITLINLILDGKEYSPRFMLKKDLPMPDSGIGSAIVSYLAYQKKHGYSKLTIDQNLFLLKRFAMYMQQKSIDFSCMERHDILSYIQECKSYAHTVSSLRQFLRYSFSEQFTMVDFSRVLDGCRKPSKGKTIDFYTPKEVIEIEKSIDRTTPLGKRNYAMVLMASRLGLRASDIRALQLSEIDWEKNEIRHVQEKTGREVILPILTEVGNAIVDYLLSARQNTAAAKELFLSFRPPHIKLSGAAMTGIFRKIICGSGVNIDGRHHGSHSLRHSLATAMIQQGTNLPTVSGVLGHASSESTMIYIGVDVASLLECSRDVPLVSEAHYSQKGGVFYD